MTDRIQVASLNAVYSPLPGRYDSAVLSKVIQCLSAEESRLVLKNVGQSMTAGGTIFIYGTVLDDTRLSPPEIAASNLFFINVYNGGQAFTEGEHREWLDESGFEDFDRVTLPDQLSIITARKKH
jgi:hypothetical protein